MDVLINKHKNMEILTENKETFRTREFARGPFTKRQAFFLLYKIGYTDKKFRFLTWRKYRLYIS